MALMVFCVSAVSVFLPFYDYNRLKPQISRLVFEATGRQLTINGNLEFKIGLEPTLIVSDIRFQNAAWGTRPELAKIKRFELQLALMPLFKGEIEVRRCVFINPDILIETDSAGEVNLALDWAKPQKPQPEPKGPSHPWKFSLAQFQIKDGSLVLKNGQTNQNVRLALEEFQMSSFEAERPARFQVKGRYEKINFEMNGTIEPPINLNWEAGPWKLRSVLKNKDGVLTLDGTLLGRLSRPKVDLYFLLKTPELAQLSQVSGIKLPHAGPVEAQGHLENIESDGLLTDPQRGWTLDLNLKAFEAAMALNGSFRGQAEKIALDFDFTIEGANLARTLRMKDQAWFNEPFKIKGHLKNKGPNLITLSKVQAKIGESDLNGLLKIDRSRRPLQMRATLSSKRLDLRPYLKPFFKSKKEECIETSAQPCKVFSQTPFHLLLPKQFTTTCDLKIKQLIFPQFVVQAVKSSIVQKENELTVQLSGSAASGGKLNGYLIIKPDNQKTSLITRIRGRNLELGQMPKDLNLQKAIQGHLDMDIRLRSQGQSMADLMANLNGYTILIMKDGQVNNKYIGQVGIDLATGLFTLFNQPAEDDFIQINCLVNRFDIEKGMTKMTVLLLDTPSARVVGQGTINLATEEIDLKLRPLPKKGFGAKGIGRISLSLGSLAKPFKLSGTLAKPTLGIDSAQAFITVGKFIGGAAAFGFAGLAVVLFSSNYDDANACQNAVQLAWQGPKKSQPLSPPKINDK
jgi:hypothetical protein